ncbi:MAG: urea carboxylase-associated family protein [Pseudomonadota bacterium]
MTIETIPARSGRAVRLKAGQHLKVINTHGHQVVDFWAFADPDVTEFLSAEHTRATTLSCFAKAGESLYTNRRRAIVHFVEDTSPGIHDLLMASCDRWRYEQLGCIEYHDNCTDNLHRVLSELSFPDHETPSPFNLWMNIPIGPDGSLSWEAPVSKPGDYVVFRAEMDCICAMSACPQDILPVNAGNPVEAHFEVLA